MNRFHVHKSAELFLVCVCVRARVCVCVHVRVRVCVCVLWKLIRGDNSPQLLDLVHHPVQLPVDALFSFCGLKAAWRTGEQHPSINIQMKINMNLCGHDNLALNPHFNTK
jgi:hypothetical protein